MPIEMIIQIISLSLLLLVPLMLWGTRPSWWTVTGCVMYPASVLIANTFHVAFYVLEPLPAVYAEAMEMAMLDAPPSAYGFALRIYTASGLLLVSVYSLMVFFALRSDIQARAVWLVVALGECFAFLEYAQCKMLIDPFGANDLHLSTVWGIEVSRYACGRVFTSWAPYMPPIVTSLYLIYVNHKYGKSHK